MLAQASIFVACAMSLSVFNIQKAKDAQGHIIEPKEEYSSGLLRYVIGRLGG